MNIYNIVKLIGQQYPKSIKVDCWDTVVVAGMVDLSLYNYLYFEEKEEIIINDSPSLITVYKRPIKQSTFYYINSYTETLEDLKTKHNRSDDKIVDTIEAMGWYRIVRMVEPNNHAVYEFRDVDKLIDVKGKIL